MGVPIPRVTLGCCPGASLGNSKTLPWTSAGLGLAASPGAGSSKDMPWSWVCDAGQNPSSKVSMPSDSSHYIFFTCNRQLGATKSKTEWGATQGSHLSLGPETSSTSRALCRHHEVDVTPTTCPVGAFASSALARRSPPMAKESWTSGWRGKQQLLPSAQPGDHESETSARGLSSFQG